MPCSNKRRLLGTALLVAAAASWPAFAKAAEVIVPVPSPYSYDDATLRQLNLRGSWGRYIGFTGNSVIEWPAVAPQLNAGNPGTYPFRGREGSLRTRPC